MVRGVMNVSISAKEMQVNVTSIPSHCKSSQYFKAHLFPQLLSRRRQRGYKNVTFDSWKRMLRLCRGDPSG